MKIAIVGSMNIEYAGGGEANARYIAELLTDNGNEVTVFGSGIPAGFNAVPGHYRFKYVPSAFSYDIMAKGTVLKYSSILSLGLIGIYTYKKIYDDIKGYDLYYFISPNIMFRNVGFRLMKDGSKVILGNHGTFFEVLDMYTMAGKVYSAILTKLIFRKFQNSGKKFLIHVQNSYQGIYYKKLNFDPSMIVELPYNNVNFSAYSCEKNKEFSVVYLGRLMDSKGVDVLLELEKKIDVKFHIVGQGPYIERLRAGKNENTIVHGYVSNAEKLKILSECDAIVVPSINESLSISAIEGLASGLYLIASSTAMGPKYIVNQDNIFGRAINRNAKAFLKEIDRIRDIKMRNPDDYYREKILRRDIAKKIFDSSVVDREFIKMLNLITDENKK